MERCRTTGRKTSGSAGRRHCQNCCRLLGSDIMGQFPIWRPQPDPSLQSPLQSLKKCRPTCKASESCDAEITEKDPQSASSLVPPQGCDCHGSRPSDQGLLFCHALLGALKASQGQEKQNARALMASSSAQHATKSSRARVAQDSQPRLDV